MPQLALDAAGVGPHGPGSGQHQRGPPKLVSGVDVALVARKKLKSQFGFSLPDGAVNLGNFKDVHSIFFSVKGYFQTDFHFPKFFLF